MNTVKTPKGTELPLISLKGKDYIMVGHRFVWFNEVEKQFTIDTEFLLLTDEQTVCRAKVIVLDSEGKVVKSATATKRETKKDFPDHTEKAETSSVGRALAMLGYGTQFALAELDEGDRLADSPIVNIPKFSPAPPTPQAAAPSSAPVVSQAPSSPVPSVDSVEPKPKPTFKKPSDNKPKW